MMAPSRRLLTSVALLVVASLLLAVWSLQSGAVTLDFAQVFHALTGSAPRNITMVVTEWRLPRVAMAILVGAALGVSGTLRASFAPYNTQDDVYALVHAVDRALEILVD
mgnify:CR=1 FL=1